MPTQTANHLPTQLNIAPRGKRWKDWQLVDGEIGFPTREAMEKYHCHPERVQALEAERLALLESTRQLNQLNDRQAAQIKELEAQLAAVQQGVQPVAWLAEYVDREGNSKWYVSTHKDLAAENDMHGAPKPLYTHPTQQGLADLRWQIVHDRISGDYIAGRACFVVQIAPAPGANIMRGSVAEHFIKAVDFAAAQAKQGQPQKGEHVWRLDVDNEPDGVFYDPLIHKHRFEAGEIYATREQAQAAAQAKQGA